VVLDLTRYVAPRVGTVPAEGRAVRRALCGHDVYLSGRGLDAIDRRRKRLYCGECWEAVMGEHALRFAVLPADPSTLGRLLGDDPGGDEPRETPQDDAGRGPAGRSTR
jgi:hypothetical protein